MRYLDLAIAPRLERSQTQRVPPPFTYTLEIHMSRIKNQIWDGVEAIDIVLGEGYAKKNPDLIGRAYQSESLNEGLKELIDAIRTASSQ